jgi:hypothetical protein
LIDSATRDLVMQRARHHCEYCQLPQAAYEAPFQIDHVVALRHRRDDSPENLAASCPKCNRKKGPNLAGIDPVTETVAPLFDPRKQKWAAHFRWNGPYIFGVSPIGRATIAVLDMNNVDRIKLRICLIADGSFPPNA